MIKNIIFDLGKVLIDYDWNILYTKLNRDIKAIDLSDSADVLLQFDAGKLTAGEFYSIVKSRFDLSLNYEEFKAAWCNIFQEIPDMINLASQLHNNYDVYIFSNTDELHFPYVWNEFPALHFFGNKLMLSYELGAVKPQKDSYLRALRKFDLKAEECLFIDDKLENTIAAEELGIRVVTHRDFNSTRQKLVEKYSIKIDLY